MYFFILSQRPKELKASIQKKSYILVKVMTNTRKRLAQCMDHRRRQILV